MKRVAFSFTVFANLLKSGLIKSTGFSHLLSLSSLRFDVILVKVYEENLTSYRYVVGKGKFILMVFFGLL